MGRFRGARPTRLTQDVPIPGFIPGAMRLLGAPARRIERRFGEPPADQAAQRVHEGPPLLRLERAQHVVLKAIADLLGFAQPALARFRHGDHTSAPVMRRRPALGQAGRPGAPCRSSRRELPAAQLGR
jgi:hypothetical protein